MESLHLIHQNDVIGVVRLCLLLTSIIFHSVSVYIAGFKQVNVSWGISHRSNIVSLYFLMSQHFYKGFRGLHNIFNPLMHNVPRWSGTLLIFKVCLTISGHYALNG